MLTVCFLWLRIITDIRDTRWSHVWQNVFSDVYNNLKKSCLSSQIPNNVITHDRKSWYRSRHRLSTKRLMFYNTAKIRGGTGFPNPTSYNCGGGGGGDLRVRPRRNNTSRNYELKYAIFSSTDRCSPSFPVTFTQYQPVILEVQKQTKHPIWNFTGPGALSESYISKHFPLSEDFIIISLLKLT